MTNDDTQTADLCAALPAESDDRATAQAAPQAHSGGDRALVEAVTRWGEEAQSEAAAAAADDGRSVCEELGQ